MTKWRVGRDDRKPALIHQRNSRSGFLVLRNPYVGRNITDRG